MLKPVCKIGTRINIVHKTVKIICVNAELKAEFKDCCTKAVPDNVQSTLNA